MNLDLICAKYGNEIANSKVDETLITKSLGVLQEDGVYSFFLYLSSVGDKARKIKEDALKLLKEDGILKNTIGNGKDPLEVLREKFNDKLDALLFAKEILEHTLVYARYHAKALENPKAEEIAKKGGA